MKRLFGITAFCMFLGLLLNGVSSADRLLVIPEGTTLSIGDVKGEVLARTDGDGQMYSVNIGLPRLEIEGAGFQDFNDSNDDATTISAQVSIIPETSFTPAIAFGVRDIGNDSNVHNSIYGGRAYYLTASKRLVLADAVNSGFNDVSVHCGIGTDSLKGLFFGVEGTLPMGLRLCGEYDSEDVNFGVSYNIIPAIRIDAASIKGDAYYGATISTRF